MYCGYGIALDRKGRWNFGNYDVKNVLNFGIDNSSSSHADNHRNNCLALGGTNGSFDVPGKIFSINFSKSKKKLCLSLNYSGDNNYLFLNKKQIFEF